MNRITGWAAAVGVIVAAAALVAVTPSDMTTSIEVPGTVGERIHSRLADVEVTEVRLADRLNVTYDDELDGSTIGVWVVVDSIVTPMMGRLSLSDSTIRIGGITYGASDILGIRSMLTQPYGAGVAQEGPIVFELPASALDAAGARSARIVFETGSDTRLDSVPVVVVDLTALEVLPSVEVGLPAIHEVAR